VSGPRSQRLWSAIVCLPLLASCASKVTNLPSGTGAPFPDAAATYSSATEQCRGVKTLSAEIALSGRAGRQKMRGRILAGFASPAQVRLEAPAPFGRPVFVLVARGQDATLVLYRDGRVLRGAPPEAIVEAIAGVSLGPDELRAAVAGCGFGAGEISTGHLFPGDWASVDGNGSATWLRRTGAAWRLVAAIRGPLEIRYEDFVSGRPSTVRIRSTQGGSGTAADLTLRLSQVDINVPLDPRAFEAEVPADAAPLTLDELRRAGPLGGESEAVH
jgi:outer membrane biogenesis lipoprotein LolB